MMFVDLSHDDLTLRERTYLRSFHLREGTQKERTTIHSKPFLKPSYFACKSLS